MKRTRGMAVVALATIMAVSGCSLIKSLKDPFSGGSHGLILLGLNSAVAIGCMEASNAIGNDAALRERVVAGITSLRDLGSGNATPADLEQRLATIFDTGNTLNSLLAGMLLGSMRAVPDSAKESAYMTLAQTTIETCGVELERATVFAAAEISGTGGGVAAVDRSARLVVSVNAQRAALKRGGL